MSAARPVECVDLASGADRVTAGGFWAVVGSFDGPVRAWRFADVQRGPVPAHTQPWVGPEPGSWESSMSRTQYCSAVDAVRERIRSGDVYQVTVCRVMHAPLRVRAGEPDARALSALLDEENPAPHAGGVHVPRDSGLPPVWVVTASPELYLRCAGGRLASGPIKGTASTADGLTAKDEAENIMITDMVRNDLQQVCEPGTVEVTALLEVQEHPGLVHLVSTVEGLLRQEADWEAILAATYPAASVSGTPQSTALQIIAELEPVARGPYCGVVGWIDADAGEAELAVAIRTFWWTEDDGGRLHFGTGAGITWGSDPEQEWRETELKAHRLVRLATGGG